MFANYHTHTCRCGHAQGEDREFVEHAIAGGIKVLGFADHCPWVFDNGYVSDIRMKLSEVEGYFRSLTDLKKEYSDDIRIYIGFEAEYIPQLIEAQDRLLADYPLDYMIMGQHFNDPEYEGDYMGAPVFRESLLIQYVDRIIEGMESGRYRYVAHPDLIRYMGGDEEYEKHMTRLCEYLKVKDIPVEINLLGMAGGRHYPSDRFFSIAQKIGNKAIIGCDAHIPGALCDSAAIKRGREFADRYGLEIVESLHGLE
ncbi:MAG: histidinol-phosphatase [Ruminococcus sp.]|uniref:histidinol-phosphatase n=1 Tax=Ruminococcus sp. TaxID=41978 RepID=UPI0025E63170|nr:histidinol-phosphatase [Ruminococcus sp.]MBR5684013.1 histidinol-phosphatase [Ruminococcus sp.]